MNLKERTYLWYLAVLRIYIGYYMLLQGWRKFQRDFPKGDWIVKLGILRLSIFFHGINDFSWTTSRRITSSLVTSS